MIGKPILGMRVYDVLSAAQWLRDRGLATTRVEGDGAGGMLALLAGALDPEIGEVTSRGMTLCWETLFQAPIYDYLPNLFLPDSLLWLDLPDVAATLAPRPFSLLAPLDARRRPAAAAEIEAAYAPCRAAYEAAGAADRLCLAVR
ncbi:MAG: hypothetical protein HYU66_03525 [Armatimonadetes bacterium]|nr:hypothetical protein [Armatimonadota bacterium]